MNEPNDITYSHVVRYICFLLKITSCSRSEPFIVGKLSIKNKAHIVHIITGKTQINAIFCNHTSFVKPLFKTNYCDEPVTNEK